MKKSIYALGLTAVLSATQVSAEAIAPTSVNEFQAGSPAVAAEVNANFQALIGAINDNAARIDALEENQGTADLAGRSYKILAFETGMFISGGWPAVFNFQENINVTFNADGTVDGLATNILEAEMGVDNPDEIEFFTDPDETFTDLTWEQSGGEVQIYDAGSPAISFQVSSDGRTLMRLDHELEADVDFESFMQTLFIGIELADQP